MNDIYKIHAKRLIILSLTAFILWEMAGFALFFFHPLYRPAEYWIPEVYAAKALTAPKADSPKIIVISGSNALFGVHSGLLAKQTGKPVLNLGVHASLGPRFYLDLLDKYAKSGDFIIIPLEYESYQDTALVSQWQADQFSTWGRDFPQRQGRLYQLEFIWKATRAYNLRIKNWKKPFPVRGQETIETLLQEKGEFSDPKTGYNLEGLNRHAEFLYDLEPRENIRQSTWAYLPEKPLTVDQSIRDLQDFAQQRNVDIYFTYPCSIKNSEFDLTTSAHLDTLQKFVDTVKEQGVHFIGIPQCYNLDIQYFYDTVYHLNAEGAILRTMFMADTINEALGIPSTAAIENLDTYIQDKKIKARTYLEKLRNASKS